MDNKCYLDPSFSVGLLPRQVLTVGLTLIYDAENRLVSVTGAATASFIYDGDGRQVKSVVGGVTTYYVGNHYEKKGTTVTKYYFAGTTRLAVRTGKLVKSDMSTLTGAIVRETLMIAACFHGIVPLVAARDEVLYNSVVRFP